MILSATLGILALLSALIGVWQTAVALRFPLHKRRSRNPVSPVPGLTYLKPIKGADVETVHCLRSWFQQQYPGGQQLLFGVSSLQDPGADAVRRVLAEFPMADAELVHCPEALGTNAKVSTLIQLGRKAKHPLWCVSDADVWAPADFAAQSVAILERADVGAVNGFYHFKNPRGLAMRWEAFAVNADFWSQVLQSASIKPVNFTLGAALVMKREALERFGGFSSIANCLADDYQLGRRMVASGSTVKLSPIVVECRSGRLSFAAVWDHQLRWARTIRTCQPWPYFLTIVSNATLWPALYWAAAGSTRSLAVIAACLACRAAQGILLERKLTGCWRISSAWMGWTKDLLQVAVWALAFTGKRVRWRGVTYEVASDGTLKLIDFGADPNPSPDQRLG